MTPTPKSDKPREAALQDAKKAYRKLISDNDHSLGTYHEADFVAGADWQYEQDKARIEKLEKALKVCKQQFEYWNYELKATIGLGMHSTLDHHIARLIDPGVRMIDEALKEVGHE